ncbi:hypothetical protein H4R99_001151 [Coemansia sp. RSA 1722]|nr:hypothetical protein LPJ57_000701 [Coemansia sp. RSA 486]KAJ2234946.1 hypothetical protein IWW45_002997 [Coemansia sp. RSA 485]KAJ2602690.1 hypothetical protein GGF39_000568 [Coemansia sp. RSA 1721]KAJ2605422.1 hypothetical protein H4R99_001151 [Coemansia sp. RSA 1722]KAJ2640259.1 hypothetical protein GGF40_000158 [Coemansia sp. RSA 1286]
MAAIAVQTAVLSGLATYWMHLLAVSAAYLAAILVRRAYFTPLRKIPGPWPNSMTNLCLLYHIITGKYQEYTYKMHAQYGPVVRIGYNQVSVSSGSDLRRILATHAFLKGHSYEANIFLSPTTFSTTDPELNRTRRRQIGNTYSIAHLRTLEDLIISHGVDSLISQWDQKAEKHQQVNYFYAYHGLALDIVGILGYGRSFGVLQTGNTRITDCTHMMMELSALQGNIRLLKYFAWPVRHLVKARAELIEVAEAAIARRKDEIAADPDVAAKRRDILQTLIEARDPETGQTLQGKPLVSEMVMLLVAGSDTTSNTLTWITMHLLHNPAVLRRLCQEIRQKFPSTATIRYDDAKTHLPYLTAVILEAMRLTPSASGYLPRRTPTTGTTVGDYYIPSGCEINVAIAASQRNPQTWSNPDVFDPERFMGEEGLVNAKEVLAFSTGVRVCVGRNLAWMEMYTVLANVLRRYDFELPEDSLYGPECVGKDGQPIHIPCATFITCGPKHPARDCRIKLTLWPGNQACADSEC